MYKFGDSVLVKYAFSVAKGRVLRHTSKMVYWTYDKCFDKAQKVSKDLIATLASWKDIAENLIYAGVPILKQHEKWVAPFDAAIFSGIVHSESDLENAERRMRQLMAKLFAKK
jgi:hypothetical protein